MVFLGLPPGPLRRDAGHAGLSGLLIDPGDRRWWHGYPVQLWPDLAILLLLLLLLLLVWGEVGFQVPRVVSRPQHP